MANSCSFSLGENLDFLDFLQKSLKHQRLSDNNDARFKSYNHQISFDVASHHF